MQSTFMAGVFLGCLIFGHLSDSFGRRLVMMAGSGQFIIFGLLTAFVKDLGVFIVIRFFVAMASMAQYTVAFVLRKSLGIIDFSFQ
jgi:MFS family permease